MKHQPRPKGSLGTISQQIVALAARPQGVTIREVAMLKGCTLERASGSIWAIKHAGHLVGDRTCKGAVYRTLPGVDWSHLVAPVIPDCLPKPSPPARRKVNKAFNAQPEAAPVAQPAKPALPAPVTINARPNTAPAGDALVMSAGAKLTRGHDWTHDPRYQCSPGERPFGAGFAAVGLGRDIDTGRGWA